MQCKMAKIQNKVLVAHCRLISSQGNPNFWGIQINIKSKSRNGASNFEEKINTEWMESYNIKG